MTERPEFARVANEIEAELRVLSAWQADPLPQERIDAGGAFGLQTMAFTQWLQFVLVPRLRDVADGTMNVPPTSQVGAQAVREFDTWPDASRLSTLLIDLDHLVQHS